MDQIYQQMWIALPKPNRDRLAHVFSVPRTGVSEVRDQTVISDGYTNDDLKHITLDKMCEYIGSQETFLRAWEITLAKCHAELNPPVGEIRKTTTVDVTETIVVTESTGEKIEEKAEIVFTSEKPWCDTCDSKGHVHKLYCPRRVKP